MQSRCHGDGRSDTKEGGPLSMYGTGNATISTNRLTRKTGISGNVHYENGAEVAKER